MVLFGPFLGKLFNDLGNAPPGGDVSSINKSATYLCYIGAALFFFVGLQFYFSCLVSTRVSHHAKMKCLDAALRLDCTYYDTKITTGDVMHVLQMNCAQIEAFFNTAVPTFFNSAALVIAGVIIAFIYGWALTLVSLSLTPVLVSIILLMGYVYKKSGHAYEDALKGK